MNCSLRAIAADTVRIVRRGSDQHFGGGEVGPRRAPRRHGPRSRRGYLTAIPVSVCSVQYGCPGGGKPKSLSWRAEACSTKGAHSGVKDWSPQE
ncbi:MAG TPA: hypothetical protein VMU94_08430 [Streptosporangiaceae bacterium]|nr:hypothetical protein [Streptosporangiaceae bacterium]